MALLLLGLLAGAVAGYVTRPGSAPIERVRIGAEPPGFGDQSEAGAPIETLPGQPLQGPPPSVGSLQDLGPLAEAGSVRQLRHIGLVVLGGGAAGFLLGFAMVGRG